MQVQLLSNRPHWYEVCAFATQVNDLCDELGAPHKFVVVNDNVNDETGEVYSAHVEYPNGSLPTIRDLEIAERELERELAARGYSAVAEFDYKAQAVCVVITAPGAAQ